MAVKRKVIRVPGVKRFQDRLVNLDEDQSKLPGDWRAFGPLPDDVPGAVAQPINDALLAIALALRQPGRYSLCGLVEELATGNASKLFLQVALHRHWKAGRIAFWVRERTDVSAAPKTDDEPSSENGYVMTKSIILSPVETKLDNWMRGQDTNSASPTETSPASSTEAKMNEIAPVIPVWEKDTGKLQFGGSLVKQVRNIKQAKNVVLILDAFQESKWPPKIDDPLPPDVDPLRLHNAIKSLNARLKKIRFRADGTGEGIVWETTDR